MTIEGEGERAQRARRRRIVGILAVAGVIGGVTGFLTGVTQSDFSLSTPFTTIPAWLAIGIAIALPITMLIGTVIYFRAVDEVERQANYWASLVTLSVFLAAYPVWFFLWKGGIVAEPDHEMLYVGTFLLTTTTYLWKKFRP